MELPAPQVSGSLDGSQVRWMDAPPLGVDQRPGSRVESKTPLDYRQAEVASQDNFDQSVSDTPKNEFAKIIEAINDNKDPKGLSGLIRKIFAFFSSLVHRSSTDIELARDKIAIEEKNSSLFSPSTSTPSISKDFSEIKDKEVFLKSALIYIGSLGEDTAKIEHLKHLLHFCKGYLTSDKGANTIAPGGGTISDADFLGTKIKKKIESLNLPKDSEIKTMLQNIPGSVDIIFGW
jgi:hypothetical protein